MVWQLAEPEYKAKKISTGGLVGAFCARRGFALITDPRFPYYIPQRMRGMAMNSGPQLRLNYYSAIWTVGQVISW